MHEIDALKYAISHLKQSMTTNPVLIVAGQAPKALVKLEEMLATEIEIKKVADKFLDEIMEGC
jgi:hypothetical protein